MVLPSLASDAHVALKRSRPLNEYLLKWFDKWLKGKETGIMDSPPVVIFDRTGKEARFENEYPLARTKWTKFYLRANPAGR